MGPGSCAEGDEQPHLQPIRQARPGTHRYTEEEETTKTQYSRWHRGFIRIPAKQCLEKLG